MTQAQALQILKTGANTFLTGEPGSGKTFLINQYLRYLKNHKIKAAVTASTGIAATHIGGITIHSFTGIGIKSSLTQADLSRLKTKQRLIRRAAKVHVLVIDEVSMLDAPTITSIDQALQTLRDRPQPFGGLQVIFVGDFFQLPPVNDHQNQSFAFESPSWSQAKPVTCYLSEQYRQSDSQFTHILKNLRHNRNLAQAHALLSRRQVEVSIQTDITRLYSHNVDVDEINTHKLQSLPGEPLSYQMQTKGRSPLVEQLKKGCLSPEVLSLKVGAQVIFTKNNYEAGFVNGTLGEVVDFEEDLPVVRTHAGDVIQAMPLDWTIEDNDRVLASITQIPLRLAWAITVHKSQGMTLDAAVVDLSRAFEYGQGYVALSRVRSLSGLHILGLNHKALEIHPTIVGIDQEFQAQSQKALQALKHYSDAELTQKHQRFIRRCGGSLKPTRSKTKQSTYDVTYDLYRSGQNISQIATTRGLKTRTITSHFERLAGDDRINQEDLLALITPELKAALPLIHQAFNQLGTDKLSPVFVHFKAKYSFDQLRLARLLLPVHT